MRFFVIGLLLGAFLIGVMNIARGLLKYHEYLKDKERTLKREEEKK